MAVLVLLGVHLASLGVALAETDGERAFREGSAAFEAGDDQTALVKMRSAFKQQPDYRTAAGLGQVELQLLRYRDAAQHLEYSLRHYPLGGDPEGKELVMKGFSVARGHVVTLTLQKQIAGAELLVDGKVFAELPVEHDLFIEAGERTLSFRKPGFVGREVRRYMAAGSAESLEVDLRVAPRRAPTPTEPVERRSSRLAPLLLISGGVATLGGLGAGAGFHLAAGAAQDDADDLRAQLRQSGVTCDGDRDAAGCKSLQAHLDRVSERRNVANIVFAGSAGLAVITLAVYGIVVSAQDEPAPGMDGGVAVLPVAGPEAAGLSLSGTF